MHELAGERMDETVEGATEGRADAAGVARRRRVRRATIWGGVAAVGGTVPISVEGMDHLPWWGSLASCLVLGLLGGFAGAVSGRREAVKTEVRRDTLDEGERQLGRYRVKLVPEGRPAPPPFKEKDYTSYSLTTTTRRLQLWEFDYLPQWSHSWRELSLAAEGHVLVVTGPQGVLGRFVLERMVVPEELVLAARRLRARAPRGPSPSSPTAPPAD
ncbi:hypothetical protein [Streptomyces sp. DSM 40907]|uniref:hypothetical protein n=1 Tax=Streptomyces kutzneri TaxID=3051179 RepID=UPI0028D4135B|nr:hypothetical protein [Streptomyces sp. DSM 40907]